MDVGLVPKHINLVCIVYALYAFDDFSLKFYIIYLTSLALIFVVANFHNLCVGKFRLG